MTHDKASDGDSMNDSRVSSDDSDTIMLQEVEETMDGKDGAVNGILFEFKQ